MIETLAIWFWAVLIFVCLGYLLVLVVEAVIDYQPPVQTPKHYRRYPKGSLSTPRDISQFIQDNPTPDRLRPGTYEYTFWQNIEDDLMGYDD